MFGCVVRGLLFCDASVVADVEEWVAVVCGSREQDVDNILFSHTLDIELVVGSHALDDEIVVIEFVIVTFD